MKTKINKIEADYKDVKNKCRTTVNKGESNIEVTETFKKKLLISEHSPIRLIRANWSWKNIPSWVATHFSRHHIGWEKWIGTRRSDRIGQDRNLLLQGEILPMEVEANAQALINVSRVRLCFGASPETREHMEDLKVSLHDNEESKEVSDVMVPNCIYRAGCPEFQECGFWDKFKEDYSAKEILNIQDRYDLYNTKFYETHSMDEVTEIED